MNTLTARFDYWVARGAFTAADLSIFRIIFAGLALLTYPRTEQLGELPASLFDPPPGLFVLVRALPPRGALVALEVLTVIVLTMLLLGWRTRCASVMTAILLTVSFGLTYSFGKIDHTILMVAVPLTLSFSSWGGRFSIDSARGRGSEATDQWPVRLLALLVGLGFVTAAGPKILTGWLSPSTQATQGHFLTKFLFEGKDNWLAPLAFGVRAGWAWEPLDWITVLLELSLVLTVLNWRAFRIALAVTCLFHLGVLLLFNIAFNTNVMAYAAFVSWAALLPQNRRRLTFGTRQRIANVAVVASPLVATTAFFLPYLLGVTGRLAVTTSIVIGGAGLSAVYLTREVLGAVRGGRSTSTLA